MYSTIGNSTGLGNIGEFNESYYWSSTSGGGTWSFWTVDFSDGSNQGIFEGTNGAAYVRPIRDF